MDYEKMYKEALEKARKKHDSKYHPDMGPGGVYLNNADLEEIFPQLKESEDERILDTVIEHFKGFSPIKVFGDFGFRSNQILAYLERQKEQKPKVECDRAQPVEQAGTAEPDYGICGNFVPGKLAAALRRHGWYLGHVGENQQMVEARKEEVMRNWPADRYSLTQEQKPAEWSEEDLQHKSWILECLADGERKMPEYAEDFRAAYNWLKSLYPQPQWKPSEEQMEALKKTTRLANFGSDAKRRDALLSLYEQLKKLICHH